MKTEMEQQQPSGHRPEGLCCSGMVGHGLCQRCEVDDRAFCESRARHAVQDDMPSKMHDLTLLIAAARQPACPASVPTHSSYAIKQENVVVAHYRVRPRCREARQSSLERYGSPSTAESGYQLLILDSPSARGEGPVICSAARTHLALQNTCFSKNVTYCVS